jgi:hypothetical protein
MKRLYLGSAFWRERREHILQRGELAITIA